MDGVRNSKGQFVKGVSGNPEGKKSGTRNKLSLDFIKKLSEDFDKHGKAAIEKMREEEPGQYVKVVASLVPKDINLGSQEENPLNIDISKYGYEQLRDIADRLRAS